MIEEYTNIYVSHSKNWAVNFLSKNIQFLSIWWFLKISKIAQKMKIIAQHTQHHSLNHHLFIGGDSTVQ